jgi:hypothetical protein
MTAPTRATPKPVTRDGVIGRRRVARKPHTCGRLTGFCAPIAHGDVYLESTQYPSSSAGHAAATGQPVRMAVCAPCVCKRGDSYALEPIPYEQCARQGLL